MSILTKEEIATLSTQATGTAPIVGCNDLVLRLLSATDQTAEQKAQVEKLQAEYAARSVQDKAKLDEWMRKATEFERMVGTAPKANPHIESVLTAAGHVVSASSRDQGKYVKDLEAALKAWRAHG